MDVRSEILLEDGEIAEEDDILAYVPLERPTNFSVENEQVIPQEKHSDDDSEYSSVSDSDSDDMSTKAKKSKIKVNRKIYAHATGKRKKYDVWSSRAHEDLLNESLTSCGVSKIDRSRAVETYIFRRYDSQENVNEYNENNYGKDKRTHNNRKYGERRNTKRIESNNAACSTYKKKNYKDKRATKRKFGERNSAKLPAHTRNSEDDDDTKGAPRIIPDLVSTNDSTEEELATEITNKLCETNDALVLKIVQIAGKKKSIDLFNHAKRIEADGGMLIMNGTKRRTPGGVFIFLLKHDNDINGTQQKEIFAESKQQLKKERKAKQRAKSKLIKSQIDLKRAGEEELPDLLNRADLTVLQLRKSEMEHRESETEEFVNNPPPSPVTDGKENSSDGTNDVITPVLTDREVNSYGDDFLDLGNTADMDLF